MPESATGLTLVLPYNDRAAVEAAFAEHGDRIACLITEAAPGNMGVVPPEPGFNEFLARTCAAHGALFVSDEVMTGFRASRQGQWGLDGAVEGWRPDLMTFGKVMGGGFPAAAFGGRADVMAHLAPEGPVYQAGTLSGNPIATTAGLTTLRLADDAVYDHLTEAGDVIKQAAAEALDRGRRARTSCSRPGTMFSVFFTDRPVRDFAGAPAQDTGALRRVLPRDARRRRLPAALGVRGVVRLGGPRRPRRADRARRPPGAARAAAKGSRMTAMTTETIVHLMRHGEVHNPRGVLYGRMPGFHLSDLGRADGRSRSPTSSRTATSPTWSPRRWSGRRRPRSRWPTRRGLEIATDERVIESANVFEGQKLRRRA